MSTRLRRVPVALAAGGLIVPTLLVVASFVPQPARADTNQDNGCLGVTNSFSTFAIPITGSASPTSIAADATTTLSGTGVTINVTSGLVLAGVNTGLVQAAPDLASVGTPGGSIAGTAQGQNAVSVATSGVKLTLQGTNASPQSQVADNPAPVNFTFWATNDGTNVKFYTGTPNPPSNSNLVDVTSAGIPVQVPLASTTWTGVGGPLAIREANTQPSSLTTPTLTDKNAAPLRLASKINNVVNVTFFCWPGTASATGTALVPLGAGPTNPIASVAVTGTSATTSTSTSTTTTTAAAPTTTTTAAPSTTTTSGPQPAPVTGTRAYGAECTNSVNDSKSTITFTTTGTTTTNAKGTDKLPLTNQSWKVDVPGSVLDTGINLGLIKAGDTIKGTLKAVVAGRGTAEGQVSADPVDLTLGPVVLDDATGLANPISATVPLGDSSWTPAGSTVDFLPAPTVVEVKIPLPSGSALTVTFNCTPPADALPFVSAVIVGETPATAAGGDTTGATVLGASATRAASAGLAATGPRRVVWLELASAIALLDVGYLTWSSARARRRRRRR